MCGRWRRSSKVGKAPGPTSTGWHPGVRTIRRANVHLGSARGMDAEAAGQKACGCKADVLVNLPTDVFIRTIH